MSELQIGLLGLGIVVVIGVLVFNKFQESRARRAAEKQFGRKHDDVLLDGQGMHGAGAVETIVAGGHVGGGDAAARSDDFVGASATAGAGAGAGAARIEPRWDEASADPFPGETAMPSSASDAPPREDSIPATLYAPATLDSRIDFIAELSVEDPALGSHVKLEVEKLAQSKNIDTDGYNEGARAWEALNRDAVYERVRVGIQLSDRGGPLKSAELEAFQNGVAGMAKQLSAWVNWRGERSPLTRAAELDEFCAGVDVLIGVNVVAQTPFAETKLRGLAEANGFTREDDGAFDGVLPPGRHAPKSTAKSSTCCAAQLATASTGKGRAI